MNDRTRESVFKAFESFSRDIVDLQKEIAITEKKLERLQFTLMEKRGLHDLYEDILQEGTDGN